MRPIADLLYRVDLTDFGAENAILYGVRRDMKKRFCARRVTSKQFATRVCMVCQGLPRFFVSLERFAVPETSLRAIASLPRRADSADFGAENAVWSGSCRGVKMRLYGYFAVSKRFLGPVQRIYRGLPRFFVRLERNTTPQTPLCALVSLL